MRATALFLYYRTALIYSCIATLLLLTALLLCKSFALIALKIKTAAATHSSKEVKQFLEHLPMVGVQLLQLPAHFGDGVGTLHGPAQVLGEGVGHHWAQERVAIQRQEQAQDRWSLLQGVQVNLLEKWEKCAR